MPQYNELRGRKDPNTTWEDSPKNEALKSVENYENKSDEPCYTPENSDGVTYNFWDFIKMATSVIEEKGVSAHVGKTARNIFDRCEWQDPHTIIDEMDWEDEFENYPESWGIDKSVELKEFKTAIESKIEEIEELLELLPRKGNNSADCQRTLLEHRLQDFGYALNGVEEKDFIKVND